MAHQDNLSSVLSEFARTMLTDFPIQGILDHLVQRIVDVLPVTGAGVTLISPDTYPQYVAASDEAALRFERLQGDLREGPCLTAYESGELVAVPDLAADHRYPQFGPACVASGLAAVFTFPMRHGDEQMGALDLYRDKIGGLTPQDLDVAQTLADVAAAYVLNAQARDQVLEVAQQYRVSALHDALTSLPNRVLLQQRLAHAAQRASRSHTTAAVLFVDLDRFKRVNDIYGHSVGDSLLIAVAQRLVGLVRPGDTLARVSGDEFVILCEDLADASDAEDLAARINEALALPIVVPGTELLITASVGIAYAGPGDAVNYQLVIDADTAMYQAKRRGGGAHRVLDLRAAREALDQDRMEQDLGVALAREDLELVYQPIVRLVDGLVLGVEALLRWTHPDRGPMPALTAIGLAERSGLIVELGAWVLETGCRQRSQWLADHPDRPLELAVNVSARQLMTRGFSEMVTTVVDATGMDPAALILEVTEGIFIDDGDRAMSILADLKAKGIRVALDDFGTGYSSLNYLRRLPVDIVKIDQGFVADVGHDAVAAAIVACVTQLANALGMTVTAEGVETQHQREGLADIGCDLAQGYLFARPMSGQQMSDHLAACHGQPLHLPPRVSIR